MRNFAMLALILLPYVARDACAIDPYAGNDPFWVLLHEPTVTAELKLSATQRKAFQKLTDDLDLRFFPLRNKSREAALAGAAEITAEARRELKTLLQPEQQKRLGEIAIRQQGNRALLLDAVADRLRYSETQRERIKEIVDATQTAITSLQKELNEGKPRGPLDKKFSELRSDQQKRLWDLLKSDQQKTLTAILGSSFDVAKLGQPRFKAPELVDSGEWINSTPLKLQQLRGKVVVIHFYAFGCINCVHNFPWYHEWHDRFQEKEVAIIGIHTPETASEKDSANVRRKATDEKFRFPILIDGKNENWNAWGNSMWPSVYLVDKRGYLREFWPGELNWQGGNGEKYMREQIELLLAESAS